ncbi:MAG: site-specific integrase [Betaproteobacteria bacterium]|nr:site-specific integrase [Betaproteobacteria bacterium]MDE2122671.1 site-specific integrase [Betaproteobacteria bacterium]
MTRISPTNTHAETPWLAQGVLDLRARFRKIVDLAEYINRPFLVDTIGTALWYMTQVDGSLTAWSSVVSMLRAWRLFCEFLDADATAGWRVPQTTHDLTSHHFVRFAGFLIPRYPSQSTRSACFYNLTGCLQVLQANQPSILAADFVVPVFPERQASTPGVRRMPYTDAQMFEIVRICRREITAVIHRLRMGRKLVASGQDPNGYRRNAWRSQANVLWYVRHAMHGAPFLSSCVDRSAHPSLNSAFHKHLAGYPSADETYAYLYPHIEDLTPFVILLHALLDENPQCIMHLRQGDIELTENTRVCRIRFVKTRPARKEFTKLYSNTSIWSPGRVIHMIKLITAPLRQWTNDPDLKDRLWVYLARRGEPVRAVPDGETTRMVADFGKKHGLPDLQLSRFRVTNLSRAYRLTGSLALIKDRARHAQMQTTVHYLTNPGTWDLHHASIETAQNEALTLVTGTVVAPQEDQSEAALLADHLRIGAEAAKRITAGEQDVFIASCKDFYNRPDGPPNTPCDRPFACFTCRNAVWTSHVLPRLIRFRDFLLAQREHLPADEWQIRFGFPYRAITEAILPAFKPEIISLAEAAAPYEPFHVPASMRGN